MSEKKFPIDPSNPFEHIPGLLEVDEFPSILDTVGDDVHSIEMRWNIHDKSKVEVAILHELFEESFFVKYELVDGEHVVAIHHPEAEHRKVVYKELDSLTPATILMLATEAVKMEIAGGRVENGWNEHPDSFVDDED